MKRQRYIDLLFKRRTERPAKKEIELSPMEVEMLEVLLRGVAHARDGGLEFGTILSLQNKGRGPI